MMNNISNYKDCTGCTSCATICPKKAITMILNEDGFYEPKVNEQLCINCGKCIKICPAQNLPEESKPKTQYACVLSNEQKVFESSSGGVFTGLAEVILKQGGVVFGAAYNEDFKGVAHYSTEEVALEKLKKSKYVVSNLRDSFFKIKTLLAIGKDVLFVGTPCQCAGLKKVIGENEKLTLVDFICGGTPSEKCFSQYFNQLAQQYKSKIIDIDFRGKDQGWKKSYLKVRFENGKKYEKFYLYDAYYSLFYMEHLTTRAICDKCPFRKSHIADITIADFWGIFKTSVPNDDKGMSLVAINTERGHQLFEKVEGKQIYSLQERDIEYAYQECLVAEDKMLKKQTFFSDLRNEDFSKVSKRYVKTDKLSVFIKRLRSYLGV